MNELQKTELDILKCFVEVCEKLHLRYYLVCGSALGAVKYGGFIPWDDDMDVALVRPDYEIFCEKAPELLPEWYFLQNYRSDPAFPCIYSKLRDSRTTYIEETSADLPIHHGIYIDVFPLDGYPEGKQAARILEAKKELYRLQLACAFRTTSGHSGKAKAFLAMERLLGFHKRTQKIARKLEALISAWPTETSALWCNHGNWGKKTEYAPVWHYGDGVFMEFEGIPVRVPEQYDAYLTRKYGLWREDLPPEQQKGHHYYLVCDTKKPYTQYYPLTAPEQGPR